MTRVSKKQKQQQGEAAEGEVKAGGETLSEGEELLTEAGDEQFAEEGKPVVADPEQLLAEARAEAAKNWDLYLRERADLENFRKRSAREKEEAIRFANDRLLREMIPILDNLERALEHAAGGAGGESLLEGVEMTINMFRKALEGFGVKPVAAIGTLFDPNLHQAMGQVETADHPPNTVSAEFQKGYLLHDRLLRPSLVMVAKAPAVASTDDEQQND
jgi:molecular chaperone GrpE